MVTRVFPLRQENPALTGSGDSEISVDWVAYVESRLDPEWRRTEWHDVTSTFVPDHNNPFTTAYECVEEGCTASTSARRGRCPGCMARGGLGKSLVRRGGGDLFSPYTSCTVRVGRYECRRQHSGCGLCMHHYRDYADWCTKFGRVDVAGYLRRVVARRLPDVPNCPVAFCGIPVRGISSGMCVVHYSRWKNRARKNGLSKSHFIEYEEPELPTFSFSLARCSPLARAEILFVLQQRDKHLKPLVPGVVKSIRDAIGYCSGSLSDLVDADSVSHKKAHLISFLNDARVILRQLRNDFVGLTGFEGDVWDPAQLGLRVTRGSPKLASWGLIDFRVIRQKWLRELAKAWGSEFVRDVKSIHEGLRGCRLASEALAGRPNGDTPTKLGLADVTAIVKHINDLQHPDGRPFDRSNRSAAIRGIRKVLEYGRAAGLMEEIPSSFTLTGQHRADGKDSEGIWKDRSLPEEVIKILDQNVDLLGDKDKSFRCWTPALRKIMIITIYKVLRDTGRRPGEILGLPRNPLVWDPHGQMYSLEYFDNKNDREEGIPIHESTARIILEWIEVRDAMPIESEWLFPSTARRRRADTEHLTPATVNGIFNRWVAQIGDFPSSAFAADGTLKPFKIEAIVPYAMRHSYAQRHSDADTKPEVLQSLMGHKDLKTTQGYYRVNTKKRQEAVRIVGATMVDIYGSSRPITDYPRYELSSVAIGHGGSCVEPSNVKAGGQRCPARYMCAGCSHYRVDLSQKPQIDEHIVALKANVELARGTAEPWVLVAMEEEVDAYRRLQKLLRDQQEQLSPEEKVMIDEAKFALRALEPLTARGAVGPGTKVDLSISFGVNGAPISMGSTGGRS